MGALDTAQKIWTFIAAGIALLASIAVATWEVRGVFARFELLEAQLADIKVELSEAKVDVSSRFAEVDDRMDRLEGRYEDAIHGN